MPDSGPDYVDLSKSCGLSATVGAQVYRLRLEVGFPHFLTSCAGARPAGRAVCVNAHARICAGPQGKPWGYRDATTVMVKKRRRRRTKALHATSV